MAEGHKTYKGAQSNHDDGQPALELNWAGCDLYGRDLLDLEETDSELLNIEALSDEAEIDIFKDIKINGQKSFKDKQLNWSEAEEAHPPIPLRNVQGNVLSSASTHERPEFPPTLLELEVQALAKVGFVKYDDSSELKREETRAKEECKLAHINPFDHDHQAFCPLPNHQQQQGKSPKREGDLPQLAKVDTILTKMSAQPTSNPPQSSSGGTDFLELQKVALSSMKGCTQKSSTIDSTSAPSPPPHVGNGDFLELQKVALSTMTRTAQHIAGPSNVPPSTSVEGMDLLELQKIGLASIKKLSEKVLSHLTTPISGPMPHQSTLGGDLLELQQSALANMLNSNNEPSPHHAASSTLHKTIVSVTQQPKRGGVAFKCRCKGNESPPRLVSATQQPKGGGTALKCRCKGNESLPKAPSTTVEQTKEGDLLELQKVALGSIQKPQPEGQEDLSKLQEISQMRLSNHDTPSPPSIEGILQVGGEDLLELQKVALRSVQSHLALAQVPQKIDRQSDIHENQKTTLQNVQSQTTSTQICHVGGGDLLELQRVAFNSMSSKTWGEKVVLEDKELKQQNNTQGGGGTSPTSSHVVFNKMSSREPLEMLLQEISSKDQALQLASRTIEEKDQLLQEYGGSLANALNLLQSMNVQCTDTKVETAKVLMEAQEICGSLKATCSIVESLDGSIQTFGNDIHLPMEPSTWSPKYKQILFHIENGKLGGNQVEIDEHKNLVKDLLNELHNIKMARTEAQEACKLQIQQNEQLIAHLQQLDITHPLLFGRDIYGCEHIDQNPQEIGRQYEDNNTSHLVNEDPSFSTKRNLCNHVFENPSDLVKGNVWDQVYEDSVDQAKGNKCDHAYENPIDPNTGNLCHHIYEDSNDQGRENLCDHTFESHPIGHANENSCAHVFESPYEHINGDPGHKVKEKPCDHNYESLSNDKAHKKPCDPVYESCLSDNNASATSSDHLCASYQSETPCDHVYVSQGDLVKVKLCDHTYSKPSAQTNENHCDHDCKNPYYQSKDIPCEHTFDIPLDLIDKNPCDHPYEQIDENPCKHNYEQTNKKLCDHTYELADEQTNEKLCDHTYTQTYEMSCDHKFESSCDHTYENSASHTSITPFDHAYKDGKDCGPIHEWENIGSAAFNSSNWMGLESDRQFIKSLGHVEVQSSSDERAKDFTHQILRHKYVARASSPNALWEHLQHFVRKQPQACDNVERIHLTTQLSKLQGDLDLKTQEMQDYIEQGKSKISELHNQINQLQTTLLQEQDGKRKILLQKSMEATDGPTKADLEHKDKIIHKLHFHMHQLEAALQQEREEMRETLAQKTNQMESTLHQKQEEMRQVLAQKIDEMSHAPTTANIVDLNLQTKEIMKLHQQLKQMKIELEKEEEKGKVLMLSVNVEMDKLQADLNARDENMRELHEGIAKKEVSWQTEKHQMMKCFDDMETKLLVKEEEVINLTHGLELSRSSVHSHPLPDEVKFSKEDNHERTHFFHKQGGTEDGREVLDLRCEVLSLRDCLEIKTQAIKTMEKELSRSYNIVTDLRSKLRGLQEFERTPQRLSQNKGLIERLRSTEDKLKTSLSEREMMSHKILDLSARCKYLEEFEHLYREGTSDMKDQAIMELEKELEKNVQIIKSMQARCNEYEARNRFEPAIRLSNSGACDSLEYDHTKLSQLNEEKKELEVECDQLQSQIKRKDQIIIQLQENVQKSKPNPNSPGHYQQNEYTIFYNDERSKNSTTNTLSAASTLEHGKVESPEVSTLKELLKDQWKLQKVLEDRLNTMMAYVSDRVNEFEQMSPSDATSTSSCPQPNIELNHFHVEAKLMKLQLEQQLQVLRGTKFLSLSTSGMTSPGPFSGQCPQNFPLTQNMQLISEKNALEDSAQTLQEKTSRLLNKLTFMRTEFGSDSG